MEQLRKHKFKSLASGKAKNVEDLFNQLIKPQFENKKEIKNFHSALINYSNHPESTLFLRLYGSFSKNNYDQLRRGFLTQFPDKSKMVYCDNTFSMLFTGIKLAGLTLSEKDLLEYFSQNRVICSFGTTSDERELSHYTSQKAVRVSLNSKGYYLAHIKPTGYGYGDVCNRNLREHFPNPDRKEWCSESRIRMAEENLSETQKNLLKAHFIRFVHPLNSFLVPKKDHMIYEGKNIGEELELIKYVQQYLKNEFPEEYAEFEKITLAHTFENSNNVLQKLEWFDTPMKKSADKKEKKTVVKKEVILAKEQVTIEEDFEVELENNLMNWLKSIGMQVFIDILYPSIFNNPKVTVKEIAKKHAQFDAFKTKSSRLSTAKSIFKNGLEAEALQIIIDSKNTKETTRNKASELMTFYL